MESYKELRYGYLKQIRQSQQINPADSEKDFFRILGDWLRLTFEFSDTCFVLLGMDYYLQAANNTLSKMLGYTEEILKCTDIRTLLHPTELSKFIDFLQQLKQQNNFATQSGKFYLLINGQYKCFEIKAFLIRAVYNQPLFYVLSLEDSSIIGKTEEFINNFKQELLPKPENTDNVFIRYNSVERQVYINPKIKEWVTSDVYESLELDPIGEFLLGSQFEKQIYHGVIHVLGKSTPIDLDVSYANGFGGTTKSKVWFLPEYNSDGKFKGVLGIGHDMTDLPAEGIESKANEMKDGSEMSAFILDRSDDVVLVTDINSNITFVNRKACDLLGYSRGELLAMKMVDIAPNLDEKILAQFPSGSNRNDDTHAIDMQYKTRNQELFPVEVKIYPFTSDSNYSVFVAKDISNRLEIYDMLWQSEQEFLTLIETSPNIIARYDLQNQCIYINEACERITGFSRYFMTGRAFGQTGLLPKDQAWFMNSNLRLVIGSGLPLEFDVVIPHATSRLPVHLQIAIIPVSDRTNKVTGVIVVANDISELKRNEAELIVARDRAEESNRMKSFFLASISHEIRTPLNCIIGLNRILKDETLAPDERGEFIDLIENSGMKLVNMIEEVIDLAKIESGQIEINIKSYLADNILKEQYLEISEMLRVNQKNDVAVRYIDETACGIKPILGDVMHIKRVLHILAANAVKFTHKGEILVGLEVTEPGLVTFYLTDNGIGIPKEKHESIFESFVQADISLSRPYEGLGIGLSLARRIARALGGDITLVSAPGQGSTFYFSLPMGLIQESESI